MSGIEFDRLLDAVRSEIAPAADGDFSAYPPGFAEPPRAANDNELTWGIIPFPDGWHAVS